MTLHGIIKNVIPTETDPELLQVTLSLQGLASSPGQPERKVTGELRLEVPRAVVRDYRLGDLFVVTADKKVA